MRRLLQTLSWSALLLTIGPSLLFFADLISLEWMKGAMLLGTLLWFGVTPLWMGRAEGESRRPEA